MTFPTIVRLIREEEGYFKEGECPIYGNIREELPDNMGDNQLVDLFTLVLEKRKQLEEEEEHTNGCWCC